jgi:hypothetical protein
MADWKNRMDMIINKIKFHLNARGVDSLTQLKDFFQVSSWRKTCPEFKSVVTPPDCRSSM